MISNQPCSLETASNWHLVRQTAPVTTGNTGDFSSVASGDTIESIGSGPGGKTEPYGVGAADLTSVAISGDSVVAGTADGAIIIWDVNTGNLKRTIIKAHARMVVCVAIYENIIVSGSWDKTIKIWDLSSGNCRHTLKGHFGVVNCVAIAKDIIVSGSGDKTLKVWDLSSGNCKRTIPLTGHNDMVTCVTISGDSIVWGSKGGNVKLWDSCFPTKILNSHKHEGYVNCVAVFEDTIVSGGIDKKVIIRKSVGTGNQLTGIKSEVKNVGIYGDNLVAGTADGTIIIFNLSSGEYVTKNLIGHVDELTCLAVRPDGKFIVSGSSDKRIRIWQSQ